MSRFIGSSPARKRAAEVLCAVVLAVYLVFLFVGCVQTGTFFIGEAASYSLTTVSLAHDGNGFVSGEELALAREWDPAPEPRRPRGAQAGTITATARGTEPLQADPWDR